MGSETLGLVLEDSRWQAADLAAVAERAARAALEGAGLNPDHCELSLLACDDARIAALNGTFRGKAAATNVLSWPAFELASARPGAPPDLPAASPDAPLFLGDLALAYETCVGEAEAEGISLADHAAHLVVHGCLHLLGYDHEDAAEAARMESLETKILAKMAIEDPYSR